MMNRRNATPGVSGLRKALSSPEPTRLDIEKHAKSHKRTTPQGLDINSRWKR
jgi:hypothetical protein